MVLSNKKLKQKIRAQLAESLAASESQKGESNLDDSQTHQSLKFLLNSATQKTKLSKREKRRVKAPSLQESKELDRGIENGGTEKEAEEGVEIANEGGSKKGKKRKREKNEGTDENEVKDLSEKKSNKKKKKKSKKKKKVKKEGEEKDVGVINERSEPQEAVAKGVGVTNEGSAPQDSVAETINTSNSKEDAGTSTKVYAGGIPYYSTVDDICSYFEGCGSITEIDCLKFPETGKFNGIAMISFRTEAAAKRALALDGSDMGGLSLKIQPYKATRDKKVSDFSPAIVEGYNRIYIGNLAWDITEDELKKLFSDCTISSIRLGKDKETGEFRGYAHIDFADSLSLSMALKLDQKPICGRPVRIRCAVPPKSVKPSSKSKLTDSMKQGEIKSVPVGAKTNEFTSETIISDAVFNDDVDNSTSRKMKGRTCYECGEKGHLSSSCPKKQAADGTNSTDKVNGISVEKAAFTSAVALAKEKADNNMVNFIDGKLRRRTCYECGEKGHVSSSCPMKQAADVANSGVKVNGISVEKAAFTSVVAVAKEDADNNIMVNSVSDGKVRRRTCYECGERGHLSSSCPKKQAADEESSHKEAGDTALAKPDAFISLMAVGKEEAHYNTMSSVSDGKLRRRTCYECGERGHLSSACPNKQAAGVANLGKEAVDMELEKADGFSSVVAGGKEADSDVVNSVSGGKLRRRTCYECGEKGHLSSSCPNKKDADQTNTGST